MSDLRETAKNRLVRFPGHFAHPVRVDAVEEIGPGFYLLKVRHSSGRPDETQVTSEELELALAEQGPVPLENRILACDLRDLRCQAARSYSLIRPLRTSFGGPATCRGRLR
ncbi:MAG TPA: hypothetical protein VIJ82_10045 [Streptosporangiaceae bacterium]